MKHTQARDVVSVVVLNYNSKHLLPRAVESILEQEYNPVELIIVDNASTDGSAQLLAQYETVATIVRQRENIGFARGMNAGYDVSHGDYIVPLNVDAVLTPTFVREAVTLFQQHPDLGVIAPEVLKVPERGAWRFWREPLALESEGGVVGLTPLLHVQLMEYGGDDWRPSFKANGACPVIRRALIEQMRARFGAGPFDPVFDTYGEDVDFAFKAWALRWRTMYARNVLAGHVRSYASALEMPDKRGRLRINLLAERFINAIRHLPLAHALRVLAVVLAKDVTMVVRQWRKGDREALRDLHIALWRVARMRHDLLAFRRAHQTWKQINFKTEVYCQNVSVADERLAR